MGVLPCARGNCSNIMCDRYSRTYGYICGDCFEELAQKGISTDIEDFMKTNPCNYDKVEAARKYFGEIFSEG